MSRHRDQQGKFATPRSPRAILGIWVAAVLSLGLLLLAGRAFAADLGSFRSCNTPAGLAINNCGKQGVNIGDFVLLGWFVLSTILVISFWTAAWRTIPRRRR